MKPCVATRYAVILVGIEHCRELLIGFFQGGDEIGSILKMHIIVTRPMDNQEFSLQLRCIRDRRTIFVAVRIILRRPHVPFRINVIIESPIGDWSDGDGGFEIFSSIE